MTKHLITTAIPYMNGAPHVGHAFEMVLTDVIVRGRRLIGDNIFFLTGADEHGSKILKTAETQSIDVMKMLDENVARFQEMNTYLNVIPDGYLRTTDQKKHWPVVQALWMKLVEKWDIYKKQYAGYYCDREERFVTEAELDENKNVIEWGAPTRWAEDENYFFRLSKYSDTIRKKIENDEVRIIPEFRKNEMLSMIGEWCMFGVMRSQTIFLAVPKIIEISMNSSRIGHAISMWLEKISPDSIVWHGLACFSQQR